MLSRLRNRSSKERIYIVPTFYGFLYGAMVLLMLGLGTIFENTALFILSSILVTFGLICMHQTHFNILSLKVESVEVPSVYVDDKNYMRVKIKNKAPATLFSINVLGGMIDCPAFEVSTQNISFIARERGGYWLKRVRVSSTYPLGLFYSWKYCTTHAHFYIYPKLSHIEKVTTEWRKQDGEGDEDFMGHRPFVFGDSAHRIDWKLHARRQKLLIKIFEAQAPDEVVLDWNKLDSDDIEEKLSVLSRAVTLCFQNQKIFSLKMPGMQFSANNTKAHYETCMKTLSVFGGRDHVEFT